VPGGDHSKSALALVTGADCCCGPKPPAAPSSTPSTRAAAGSRPVNLFNLASGLRSRTVDRRRDLPPSPRWKRFSGASRIRCRETPSSVKLLGRTAARPDHACRLPSTPPTRRVGPAPGTRNSRRGACSTGPNGGHW